MEIFGLAAGLVLLADLYAMIRTIRSDATRTLKALWVSLVLVLPFFGVVAWVLFGPS